MHIVYFGWFYYYCASSDRFSFRFAHLLCKQWIAICDLINYCHGLSYRFILGFNFKLSAKVPFVIHTANIESGWKPEIVQGFWPKNKPNFRYDIIVLLLIRPFHKFHHIVKYIFRYMNITKYSFEWFSQIGQVVFFLH